MYVLSLLKFVLSFILCLLTWPSVEQMLNLQTLFRIFCFIIFSYMCVYNILYYYNFMLCMQ